MKKMPLLLGIAIVLSAALFTGCPSSKSAEEESKEQRQASIREEAQRREMSEHNEAINDVTAQIDNILS